jgi:DNA-binding beta-propeller fold protein YncE/thiol-disulfide isomerase/thioredoxin
LAVRAPDLPPDAVWLNVERPLGAEDLRGRVILLDFWRFSSIDSLQGLPVLEAIEWELEGEPFVVIGVHSPKFPYEQDPEVVQEAVRRNGVTHPVVVDSDHATWNRFGVTTWPTRALIDAQGYLIGGNSGRPDLGELLGTIREVLDRARPRSLSQQEPLPIRPENGSTGSLAYPSKLIVGSRGRLVIVADTGHDQVLVADARGTEILRIGSGRSGFADGPFDEARFHRPVGLALAGETLYIADTGNHAIRAADLRSRSVATVAGTGSQGQGTTSGRVPGRRAALSSPWDLAWDETRSLLYVAMAGSHQLWSFDPTHETIEAFAGSGQEGDEDGPAEGGSLAQPSGVVLQDGVLYLADSQSSSIRSIAQRDEDLWVGTVCGSRELPGFGDRDGTGEQALLQHPMGIASGDGVLYVADTFNHKVKRVDLASGECTTLFGNGQIERLEEFPAGHQLKPVDSGTPAFFEPQGLAWRDGELLVADTNNHRVVSIRLVGGERRVFIGG